MEVRVVKKSFLWLFIVAFLSSASFMACEEKKEEKAEKGEAAEKDKDKGDKDKADAPEEQLLKAMQDVADLLDKHKEDPELAIAAVRGYVEKNEAALKATVEAVRTKADAMTPEEQDSFWERNTSRDEYQLWDGAMRRFEDTFPERYAELEEVTNTIQSAGTEELIETDEADTPAPAAPEEQLEAARASFKAIEENACADLTAENMATKLSEFVAKVAESEALARGAAAASTDGATAVQALRLAGDVNTMSMEKIAALEVEGVDADALKAATQSHLDGLKVRATEAYKAAANKAAQESIDNEDLAHINAQLKALGAE